MAASVEQLRIYQKARELEDAVFEIVKQFPPDQYYGAGNDLRRSSAAVAHYIMEAHRFYSYRLKLDALANMRREAEMAQKQLESAQTLGVDATLGQDYTSIIKQSWGLTKWLKTKLAQKNEQAVIVAKEEMAEALA